MLLRFNTLYFFGISALLIFFAACEPVESEKSSTFIAYQQIDHPLADSLIEMQSLAELAASLFWSDSNNILDSLNGFPLGGLISDHLAIPTDTTLSKSYRLSIHQQDEQAPGNWLSESSIEAVADPKLTLPYLQMRAQQLARQGVHLDLDFQLAFLPEDSIGRARQLHNWKTRSKTARSFRQVVALSGIGNLMTPIDSIPLNREHPIVEHLKPFIEQGLAIIRFEASELNSISSTLPLDSIQTFIRDSLEFRGLLVLDLDIPKAHTPDRLESYLKAGFQTFTRPPEEDFTNLDWDSFAERNRKIILDAAYEQLQIAEWTGALSNHQKLNRLHIAPIDPIAQELIRIQLFEKSICLIAEPDHLIPVPNRHLDQVYLLSIGKRRPAHFIDQVRAYSNPGLFHYREPWTAKVNKADQNHFKQVIIGIYDLPLDTCDHKKLIEGIRTLADRKKVCVVNFGHPENIRWFDERVAFMQVFDHHPDAQKLAAQALFGGRSISGIWPLPSNHRIASYQGIQHKALDRFSYVLPEELGIKRQLAETIDSIIRLGIYNSAMPGCQVFIAKDGKVLLDQSFGHHTYNRNQIVRGQDLYDLASISKVAGTTLSAMLLYQQNKFKLSDSLSHHLDLPEESTIDDIQIRSLLQHQSGLQANMPILPYIVYQRGGIHRYDSYFCWDDQQDFGIEVADDFYLQQEYIDSMWNTVYSLPVDTKQGFQYSDVNFNLLQKLVERKAMMSMDLLLYQDIYEKLNLRQITYRPLQNFERREIVPTENDEYWRSQLLQGHVHDESAALLGGVAGNAGLFANARDLAVLFQLLLNEGRYGDEQLLNPSTVRRFTSTQAETLRGLGFDKQKSGGTPGCAASASLNTFGHTGYTGTCVWADPDNGLLYVFLSNRVHPTRNHRSLYKMQIREKIHQAIYDAFDTYPDNQKPIDAPTGLSMLESKKH